MSSNESFINIIASNFSTLYFKYLEKACTLGSIIGLCYSLSHLMDITDKNRRTKKQIMLNRINQDEDLLTDEEVAKCHNSNLYNFSVIITGPIFGISLGLIWPFVITLGPIYYVFANILGPFVNSFLIISTTVKNENKKKSDKKDY